MAVGANRPQVGDRINLVFSADAGEIMQVMDMDVALAEIAVDLTEVEAADDAAGPVVGNARPSCSGVSFIGVHPDLMRGPFHESAGSATSPGSSIGARPSFSK